jgi:fumarylacetoacetate (FAA) hydrolase
MLPYRPRIALVRIAHVRERNGAAGAPWRLAAGPTWRDGPWLDLEVARRRLIAADPRLAHNSVLFRQPITTLDELLGRGLRVAAIGEILDGFADGGGPRGDDDEAVLEAAHLAFGPPILRPPTFRDFYAFEQHVATMWGRRGSEIPEAWYRLPIFYFSNVSELRGPGEAVWAPRGSSELDFELEIGALVDTPVHNLSEERAAEAIGGYFVLNDWSARDLQRDESTVRLGPAKGKDFALSIGPWLVTPDELADRWPAGATAPDLIATATVVGADGRTVEVSRGSWSIARYSFGQMLERASADVHIRPGEILGTGTLGTGCLLEVKDDTLGRWLEPGDQVTLAVERLGELRTPVIARPSS